MLERFDQALFLLINGWNSPLWDNIMWAFSGKLIWAPLYLAILLYLAREYRRKIWLIVVFIALAITLSDQISVHLFKNLFCRLRPCHEPLLDGLVHLVNGRCGGQYGFVSSHAANTFNLTVFTSLLIKKRWYTTAMIIWATIICYSRVYLGVHYPGDVICGSLLGVVIGYSVYKLYLYTLNRFSRNNG
ncbi:MAG TPA: phosphatase PAP2 family protein [Bacteroidetes bacterium]|nr:phosphatase PAP2 family protein [Bacteroidota bacterium]